MVLAARRAAAGAGALAAIAPALGEAAEVTPCLCVFDIDRTLTGMQGDIKKCPKNKVLEGMKDGGFDASGDATLSEFAASGIASTFCDECYLSLVSAGIASGEGSPWREYLLDNVMKGKVHNNLFNKNTDQWSYGGDPPPWDVEAGKTRDDKGQIRSPWVLQQSDGLKQNSVKEILKWYKTQGVQLDPSEVYFFDDRDENVEAFGEAGFNSRQISCDSRTPNPHDASVSVGYCGALTSEIKREKGNVLCINALPEAAPKTNKVLDVLMWTGIAAVVLILGFAICLCVVIMRQKKAPEQVGIELTRPPASRGSGRSQPGCGLESQVRPFTSQFVDRVEPEDDFVLAPEELEVQVGVADDENAKVFGGTIGFEQSA